MRYIHPSVVEALEEGKMAFVSGPRQVGKTTFAKSLLSVPDNYFTWDLDEHRRTLIREATSFWSSGDAGTARIVLDEIHKYPRFKRFLKGLYDTQGDRLEVIVTGSGRLDIYQKGGDSLLGRYRLNRLHPFTVGEWLAGGRQSVIAPDELATAVESLPTMSGAAEVLSLIDRFGGFPEPLFAARADRLRRWRKARRELVLREDLRDLTRIRDLGLVDHLVELLPDRVGSPISVNALREELGVAFDSVKAWIATLARLYYVFEIRPFAGRLTRTLRKEAKVYLFDATGIGDEGARLENVVALHLLKLVDAWNDLGYGDFSLGYVRDKERREVDFIVVDGRKPYALIETKLADDRPAAALRYFRDRMRPRFALQLFRHGRARHDDGLISAPVERFLALL